MAIPDYETFMLPVLEHVRDGKDHPRIAIIDAVADELGVTDEERQDMIPSGRVATYVSRGGWALTYLTQAGVLMRPRRAVYRITERGKELLARNLTKIDGSILDDYKEFRDFKTRGSGQVSAAGDTCAPTSGSTDQQLTARGSPEELLESSYGTLRADLATQLLDSLRAATPSRFETIVVDVLQAMGYGGGRAGAARAIGRVGDGGIDGVIDEDRLGLDTVYVQAKRWEGNVGRPVVQAFAGALQGHRAHKGVMITTSDYTEEAKVYASSQSTRIVLIDGKRLSELMIDFDVGVSREATYVIKRLDSDYFEE